MANGKFYRGMLALGLCGFTAGSVLGGGNVAAWASQPQAEDAQQRNDKKEKADRLAVPEGNDIEVLLDFIDGLHKTSRRPPQAKPDSPEMKKYIKEMVEIARALASANGKILAANSTEEQALQAAQRKLQALQMLQHMGDHDAGWKRIDFIESLQNDPRPAVQNFANGFELPKEELQMLAFQVRTQGDEARDPFIAKMKEYFGRDNLTSEDVEFALGFSKTIERMVLPKSPATAAKAHEILVNALESSDEPTAQSAAENMQAVLRQMQLYDTPMKIEGTLLSGEKFDWKPYEGKVVVVDFWGTFCSPCIREIPSLLKHYEKYHDQGFEVIAISVDHSREPLEKFVKDREIPWTNLYDGRDNPVKRYYGIRGLPTTLLLGRDGKVLLFDARGEKLSQELEKLFENKGGVDSESQ